MSDPNYRGTVEEREQRTVAPEQNVGVYDNQKGTSSQSRTMTWIWIAVAVLVIILLLWWLL